MIESSDTIQELTIEPLKKSARFDVRFGLMGLVSGAAMLQTQLTIGPTEKDRAIENADVSAIVQAVQLSVPIIILLCGAVLLTKGLMTLRKIPKDLREGYSFLWLPLEPVESAKKK